MIKEDFSAALRKVDRVLYVEAFTAISEGSIWMFSESGGADDGNTTELGNAGRDGRIYDW